MVKRRRHKKKLNQPKRPITAFFFFQTERRTSLKKEKPDLDNRRLILAMSEEWNKMKDEDKAKYIEKAAEDRKRYEKEKAEFDQKMVNNGLDFGDD